MKHPGTILLPASGGSRNLSRRRPWPNNVSVMGCKEGMAHVFAVQVQSWFNITRVAVQGWSEPWIYPLLQIFGRALGQCRVVNCLEARKLSWYIGLHLGVDVGIQVPKPLPIYLGCRGKSKNCDKPINYTVRVSGRFLFFKLSWQIGQEVQH